MKKKDKKTKERQIVNIKLQNNPVLTNSRQKVEVWFNDGNNNPELPDLIIEKPWELTTIVEISDLLNHIFLHGYYRLWLHFDENNQPFALSKDGIIK